MSTKYRKNARQSTYYVDVAIDLADPHMWKLVEAELGKWLVSLVKNRVTRSGLTMEELMSAERQLADD